MKKLLLALGLFLAGAGFAVSQVNVVPQTGVTFGYVPKSTYSAGFVGLVPAASTTDLVCIAGSSTKTVVVQYMQLHGSAGTTLLNPVAMIRRAAADSGGTAATTTANPANTITKMDTSIATATATLVSYTANPTINDSAGTILAVRQMGVSLTTMATVGYPAEFNFLSAPVNLRNGLVLRGAAQQICLNLTATSIASGLLTGQILWTEE